MSPKPWYHKGLRFECTGCGNCCRNHGDYSYVYLAQDDVRAIAAHLGLEREAFLERYCQEEDGWISLRMDRPACPFLTEANRCSVYPVRPKQCVAWPFWTENLERATWEGPVKECCPGIGSGPLYSGDEVKRIASDNDEFNVE